MKPVAALEGEGGGGDGEELVEIGADGFAAAEDGVEQAHGRHSFKSAQRDRSVEMRDSWSRRCSSVGCVEKIRPMDSFAEKAGRK